MFRGITSVLWVLTDISYYRKKLIFKNPHTKETFRHGAKTIIVTRITLAIILSFLNFLDFKMMKKKGFKYSVLKFYHLK